MSRRTRARFLLFTLVGVVGLATGGGAVGAVGLDPLRFFPPGSPFAGIPPTTQSVALNSRGDVVVGEEVRTQNGTLVTPTVRTRTGSRGPWSQIVTLAKPTNDTSEPQVAINARGNRIAVFRRIGRYVASRQRPTGWRLSSIDAPAPTTDDVSVITITSGGRGRFVHALPDTECDPRPAACPWTVRVYDQQSTRGSWIRGDDSLRIASTQRPTIALNQRGDVLVAWSTPGPSGRVTASRRLMSETAFEAPLTVSDPGVRGDVHAALGNGGDAAVGWVHPDTPGASSEFTGRIDVSVRRDGLPEWATAETVVPAGAANPDLDLAVDSAGNVVLAWTTFPASAAAPQTVDASIRSAAASAWVPSPRLDSAPVGDGASLALLDVMAGGGRAFVTFEKRIGPDADIHRLAIGDTAGWTVQTLAGNADLTAGDTEAPPAVAAVAPNGALILVASGLQVRNYDAATTLPAARAGALVVKLTNRSAELRFRLNAQARVFVLRRSGANFRRNGQYPVRVFPAGANQMILGRLAVGRYLVGIVACSRSRGCTATRFVQFSIR